MKWKNSDNRTHKDLLRERIYGCSPPPYIHPHVLRGLIYQSCPHYQRAINGFFIKKLFFNFVTHIRGRSWLVWLIQLLSAIIKQAFLNLRKKNILVLFLKFWFHSRTNSMCFLTNMLGYSGACHIVPFVLMILFYTYF